MEGTELADLILVIGMVLFIGVGLAFGIMSISNQIKEQMQTEELPPFTSTCPPPNCCAYQGATCLANFTNDSSGSCEPVTVTVLDKEKCIEIPIDINFTTALENADHKGRSRC